MTDNYPSGSMPAPPWAESPVPEPPAYGHRPEFPEYANSPVPGQQAEKSHGTADVVKDQAADLGHGTVEAGKHAVGVTQEQASAVAAEAGRQGKDLLRQAQQELGQQAAQGQQRLAAELLSLSDELSSMTDGSSQNGAATGLARQAATRARVAGQWLSDREPAQVTDELQSFARRRPGTFLAFAAGAGLVAGRLTRGMKAAHDHDSPTAATTSTRTQEFRGQPDQPAGNAGYRPEADALVTGNGTGTEGTL
jgi:hypothetical protein